MQASVSLLRRQISRWVDRRMETIDLIDLIVRALKSMVPA
jgi:hypothetical protein